MFTDGRIYTADAKGSWAQALAIGDGRFAAVGSKEAVRAAVPGGTPEISLGGRTVVPGFVDAHNHFLQTAHSLTWVDVRFPKVASINDLSTVIAEAARTKPAGQWVRALGLDHAQFPESRLPTRWDLDRATTDHPVLVRHVSGHHALVNTEALRRRVGEGAPDPTGGQFLRDGGGRLNGWCLDAAMELVLPVVVDVGNHGPNIHFEAAIGELVDGLEIGTRRYLSVGLTTVCDPQVTRRELAAYREGRRRGTLGIRVVCMPLSHQLEALSATGIAGPFGDDWLAIGPMKLYADGALTGGTACFREPYGTSGEYSGSFYHEPEELGSLVSRALGDGWQVGVHAQGDRAIAMVLDAIEAGSGHPAEGRHRIEHAGYPGDELDRLARLGVIPVSQPGYLYDFGDYTPVHHISAAVNRRTRSGRPIGIDQALSIEEAIRAYTIDAARSLLAEDRLGSIEVGKLADFVVFREDPFAMQAERLADAAVWATVIDGQVAYQAGDST